MNWKKVTVIQWIGLALSLIATVFGIVFIVYGFFKQDTEKIVFIFPSFLFAVVSYLLCGGLGHTIKAAFGIAKTMWFIIPHFPLNILLGFVGFVFGLLALFFLPIFFTIKSIKEKQLRS